MLKIKKLKGKQKGRPKVNVKMEFDLDFWTALGVIVVIGILL